MKFDLADLTVKAAAYHERDRQRAIARRRYRERMKAVNERLQERFKDPVEVEKYLEGDQ